VFFKIGPAVVFFVSMLIHTEKTADGKDFNLNLDLKRRSYKSTIAMFIVLAVLTILAAYYSMKDITFTFEHLPPFLQNWFS
jgi:hypothetical protein